MLIPINREKFEQLIPLVATGPQYNYCWGKAREFLKRLLISVIGVVIVWVIHLFLGNSFDAVSLVLGVGAGFYWLWGPIFWAGQRNRKLRDYKYSGFWRGRVLDIYVTEELTREEEDVNQKGELVIIENRERRLNIEVGDETGFRVDLQVPLKRIYKQIARGMTAEMLVVAYQPSLTRLEKFTDIYLPENDLWVSDYPYLQRQVFEDLSRRIGSDRSPRDEAPRYRNNNDRYDSDYDQDYDQDYNNGSNNADDRPYAPRNNNRDLDSNYDDYNNRKLPEDRDNYESDRPLGRRELSPKRSTRETRKSNPNKNRRSPNRRPRT